MSQTTGVLTNGNWKMTAAVAAAFFLLIAVDGARADNLGNTKSDKPGDTKSQTTTSNSSKSQAPTPTPKSRNTIGSATGGAGSGK